MLIHSFSAIYTSRVQLPFQAFPTIQFLVACSMQIPSKLDNRQPGKEVCKWIYMGDFHIENLSYVLPLFPKLAKEGYRTWYNLLHMKSRVYMTLLNRCPCDMRSPIPQIGGLRPHITIEIENSGDVEILQ